MNMIKENKWKDSFGCLRNPGKGLVLKMMDRHVCKVNQQCDGNCLSYRRKSMIITGMDLNTKGEWEVTQLTPDICPIKRKHQRVFDAPRGVILQNKQGYFPMWTALVNTH